MLLVLAATYRLPFLVPSHPNASLSYLVGFNNHVAMMTLLAGSLLFALVTRGAGLQLPAVEGPPEGGPLLRRWSTYVLTAVFLLTVVIFAFYAAKVRGAGMPAPAEAAYFMDRYHEALLGGRIYRDFTFDYGPLMFFPPVWLHRLTGIAFIDAYLATLLLQWLAGFAALWYVLRHLASSSMGRALTFLLVALAWLAAIVDLGVNYTPLRFLLSSLAAVVVYRLYRRGAAGWKVSLAGILSFAVLFCYSPEQGVAFLVATLLFFAVCVRERRLAVAAALFVAGCGVVLALGAHLGLLQTLFTFGGGNYDLPLLPSKQTVSILLGLVCAACLVVTSFLRKDTARVELYLISLAIAGCPAAFGRADPGHVFINTLPALLVVLMLVLRRMRVGMLVTLTASCLFLQVAYKSHFLKAAGVYEWVRTNQQNSGFDANAVAAVKLVSSRPILAPFSLPVTRRVMEGLPIHSGQFYGFLMPNRTLAERKVAELRKSPDTRILVPKNFEQGCLPATAHDVDAVVEIVLVTRFVPPMVHTADVGSTLCEYVRTRYVPVEGSPAGWSYQLMQMRPQ